MCQSWAFGLIWPLNRLPHFKLPSQKGTPKQSQKALLQPGDLRMLNKLHPDDSHLLQQDDFFSSNR